MNKKKEANRVGRPTKFRDEMCEQAVDLMREGASLNEVAALLGINQDTLHDWKKTNPKFSESLKRGVALSLAWWERNGRTNLENKDFSAVLWYMNMKNRFGWRDKTSHEHEGKITLEGLVNSSFKDD